MNTEILSADKDPMGAAILDFQKQGKAARLRVLSSMFEEDEMPVTHLFRSVPEMPMLEQKALQLAKGRVLDIGAGSGCHTLALQEKGFTVKAIDISPLSCEAMKLNKLLRWGIITVTGGRFPCCGRAACRFLRQKFRPPATVKTPSRHVWQHPLPAATRLGNGGKCAFATWQNFEMQNT